MNALVNGEQNIKAFIQAWASKIEVDEDEDHGYIPKHLLRG